MTISEWMNESFSNGYIWSMGFFGSIILIALFLIYVITLFIEPKETLHKTKIIMKKIIYVIVNIIWTLAEIVIWIFRKIEIAMEKIADFMDGGESDE